MSIIFVTGYFGAPIMEEARQIASSKGRQVLDLDRLIEEKDGRSIARLCMMGGEHAYRNAEYEAVMDLCGSSDEGSPGAGAGEHEDPGAGAAEREDAGAAALVVACGDGVLYDDDTRALILRQELVIAGADLPLEELWEKAKRDETTYHAFMKFGTEEEKRAKFEEHHKRQQALFDQVRRELSEKR